VTQAPPPGQTEEEISLGREEIDLVYERYGGHDAEIVALGCPHCSAAELKRIADLLEGKRVKRELWVCTSRKIADANPEASAKIEEAGGKVICDTCMVVSPATERYRKMMVNSGKALAYLPGLCGVEAALGTTEQCIEIATREG
jgi:predicted aconitase